MSEEEPLYVYCILHGQVNEKFGNIGIGKRGDQVYTRPFKDLTAIVSRTDQHAFERNEENVLAHQHVLQKIFARFAALPLPFSTIVESEKELDTLLTVRYDEFREKLEKLRETVQPVDMEPGTEVVQEALAQSFASALRIRQLNDEATRLRAAPSVKPDDAVKELLLEVKSLKQELHVLRSMRDSLADAIERIKAAGAVQPSPTIARSEELSEQVKKLRNELESIKKIQMEAGTFTESAEQMLRQIMDKAGMSAEKERNSGATYT